MVIPDWVSCEIVLESDLAACSLYKRNLANFIKKVKRSPFHYIISTDPADFHFFYHQMYLPYTEKRFGKTRVEISKETMRHNFDNGELLLVKQEEQVVAGGIINYSILEGIPRGTQIGVYHGNFEYVKRGALLAYYYYSINYLKKQGYKTFSLGSTRPLFNDGVLRHKLIWGAKVICEASNALLLWPLSKNMAIRKFLLSNSFICNDKKGPVLRVFADRNQQNKKSLPLSEQQLKRCGIYSQHILEI